jgi:hypothetical protein
MGNSIRAVFAQYLRALAKKVEDGEVDVHEVFMEYIDYKYTQPFPHTPVGVKTTLITSVRKKT